VTIKRFRRTVVAAAATVTVAVTGYPGPAQAATIPKPPAVCNPLRAAGHPVMTSFARTPTSVNVTFRSKQVAFTITAKDSTKAITSVTVDIRSPEIAGAQREQLAFLDLTGGTARNGTWKGTATIPQWTNNGTWDILEVDLVDAGGGFASFFPGGGSGHWNNTWPKTFHVTATPDTTAPTVSALTLSTGSVDTSTVAKKINVTVIAGDDQSGIKGNVFVSGVVDIGDHGYLTSEAFLTRTSGTAKEGIFTGSFTVPRWVGNGTHTWSLMLSTSDVAGNSLELNGDQLRAEHVTSTFRVKSETDNTKPLLTDLTYAPLSVDARTGFKKVLVTLKASDAQSGIRLAHVQFTSRSGDFADRTLARTAGTRSSGTWTGSVVIPRCSEPGVWTVSLDLTDLVDNTVHFATAQVDTRHFTSTLQVKALDVEGPGGSVPAKIAPKGPVTVTFTEPTLWKNGTAQSALAVVNDGTSIPAAGTWTCKNSAGTTVRCDAQRADVTKAIFKPRSPLASHDLYDVEAVGHKIFDTSGNGLLFFANVETT
jgi:hypothetical protein